MKRAGFGTQGDAALKILSEFYPRITRDKRKIARLAIFPNFSLREKLLLSQMLNAI